MRARRSFAQDLLRSVMALCVVLYPVLSIAQEAGKAPSQSPSVSGTEPARAAAQQPAQPNAGAPAETKALAQNAPANGAPPRKGGAQGTSTIIYLRVDGNLAGRVSILDALGNRVPARAHVSFLQSAQTVRAADSDEQGRFQVAGLEPGVFSVIASGPDGFAAASVQVLAYAQDAPKEQLTLNLTLVPAGEADSLSALLAQTLKDPPLSTQGAGGCCCGGGGGGGGFGGVGGWGLLGAALGAAGLGVGIAALAKEPASPHTF
jgi:hypothetical protein